MVTVEYGGGPSLEQRRKFCNSEGGHIPGYMGFCPQFNYRSGKTFTKETAKITEDLPYYNGLQTQEPHHLYPIIGDLKEAAVKSVFKDEVPGRMLPKSTGDNKYIAGTIPGYSGDVPRMNFKFGATYRQLTDECVDEFVRKYKCDERKQEELREIAGLFPPLRPIAGDPRVRNHMNIWTDDMIKRNTTVPAVRGPTDPPIPGYQGFVPRVESTEAGLSKRFHEAARNGLEVFRNENKAHWSRLEDPMTAVNKDVVIPSSIKQAREGFIGSRVYNKDGMIPAYDAHVPGFQFESGQNYGNLTRDLEVCAHPFPSYGEYVREKDIASKYVR